MIWKVKMKVKLVAAVFLVSFGVLVKAENDEHKLFVLLLDGFRWDYFKYSKLKLKAYPHFVKYGVKAPYLNPVKPSLTYPNVNSFVTGLYPENHGFIDNYLWDRRTKTFFTMLPDENATDPMWWNDAEPIWITAEKSKKHAGLYWWPGCEVRIHSNHPSICERLRYELPTEEGKTDVYERINDIVRMFQPSPNLKQNRLDLAMMYIPWPDWSGHYRGISSKEMMQSISYVDNILNYLLISLKKAKLQDKVNIIVVSDHGMQDVTNATYITLDKYADNIRYQINNGPTSALVPLFAKEEKLFNDIKNDKIKGLHIYRSKDIPENFHLKHASRIAPIVLEADPHYFIKGLKNSSKRIGDEYYQYRAENGYDPEQDKDMKSIFMAIGPDFRSGFVTKPLDIIDIYNVMCHLLKIEPLPNNGTWEHVEPMLRTPRDAPFHSKSSACLYHPPILLLFIFTFHIIKRYFSF